MGAFLSGLLGAAGKDIEQQSERDYQERKQERTERLRILDLAASNPNTKPDALPSIFAEMDEVARDAGYKHPGKVKDPFTQMGKAVVGILHKRRQSQQQQQQAQQAQADIQNAPGQTVSPQGGIATPPFLPAGQGRQTAPMPPSRFYTQAELDARQQAEEGRKDTREEAKEKRQHGYRMEEIEAKPKGQKFTPFHINGANVPEDVEADALGNPIDREKGIYKMEEISGRFYPVTSGPKSAGVGDQLTQWTKIILAKNPKLSPEQATQQAATELFKGKFVLPQQRLDAMKNTIRTIMGENALLTVPTHAGGPAPRAIQFPNMPQTPPMPASSGPVQRAAGAQNVPRGTLPAAAAGQPPLANQPPPERWRPEVKGAERARKTNAEVIMKRGGDGIAAFNTLSQKYPQLFGPGAARLEDAEKTIGVADPLIGTVKGAIGSFIGFLPALHGFRSQSAITEWKKTLDDPLKNPQYTIAVMREMMIAAQEVRESILNRSVAPMTAAGEEKRAAAESAAPIVQKNKNTGAFRYSTDGGATWQTGQPPK
jgi:hypothetical protein